MIACLVSVVVPAFNQAAYLGQAIESALGQGYAPQEVIVVDDGSTDETPAVVARYGDQVRYLPQANAGPSAARNAGIRAAVGEYIALLDADDVWLPNKIEAQIAAFQAMPDLGLVHGGYLEADADLSSASMVDPLACPAGDALATVLPYNRVAISTVVVRADWLGQVGAFETSLRACEDWDLWIRLAMAGCKFGRVAGPVAIYRRHGASFTADRRRLVLATCVTLDRAFQRGAEAEDLESLSRTCYREHHLQASLIYEAAGDEAIARDHLRQALSIKGYEGDPLDFVAAYARWSAARSGRSPSEIAEQRIGRIIAATSAGLLDAEPIIAGMLRTFRSRALLHAAKLALCSRPWRSAHLVVQALLTDPTILHDERVRRRSLDWLAPKLKRVVGRPLLPGSRRPRDTRDQDPDR